MLFIVIFTPKPQKTAPPIPKVTPKRPFTPLPTIGLEYKQSVLCSKNYDYLRGRKPFRQAETAKNTQRLNKILKP